MSASQADDWTAPLLQLLGHLNATTGIAARLQSDGLARLLREHAEFREDAARLDWIAAQPDDVDHEFCPPGNHGGAPGHWLYTLETQKKPYFIEFEGNSLREAIDAARSPLSAPGDTT